MSCKYTKLLEVIGLRPRTPPPGVFVSLNVYNARRQSGLSHPSTRVIVRISIWTLLVLLLAFMFVYTTILVYVDNTFLQKSSSRGHSKHRKMKLAGRFRMLSNNWNSISNNAWDGNHDTTHRKAVWNTSKFYNDDMQLPQCKFQAVFRILVASTPKNKRQRQAIRNTWCNPENLGKEPSIGHCIFLVGTTKDEELNVEIGKEQEEHNDMLFGNYFDAYENLTLKVIHGFNWSVHHCPSSFIVKVDDDCFVNTPLLQHFFLYNNKVTNNLYTGSILRDKRKLKVKRNNQKWSVPYEDFADEYYHPYASGMGYIVSKDVAHKIIKESAFIKPIVNEDAYVGIVIHHLGIEPTSSGRFVLSPVGLSVCNFMYLFVVHDVLPEIQEELLEKTLRATRVCHHHNVISTWS